MDKNQLHQKFEEFELTHTESGGEGNSDSTVKDFSGLIIKTTLNKPYKGKTLLYQKVIGQKGQKRQLNHFCQIAWEMNKLIK